MQKDERAHVESKRRGVYREHTNLSGPSQPAAVGDWLGYTPRLFTRKFLS